MCVIGRARWGRGRPPCVRRLLRAQARRLDPRSTRPHRRCAVEGEAGGGSWRTDLQGTSTNASSRIGTTRARRTTGGHSETLPSPYLMVCWHTCSEQPSSCKTNGTHGFPTKRSGAVSRCPSSRVNDRRAGRRPSAPCSTTPDQPTNTTPGGDPAAQPWWRLPWWPARRRPPSRTHRRGGFGRRDTTLETIGESEQSERRTPGERAI